MLPNCLNVIQHWSRLINKRRKDSVKLWRLEETEKNNFLFYSLNHFLSLFSRKPLFPPQLSSGYNHPACIESPIHPFIHVRLSIVPPRVGPFKPLFPVFVLWSFFIARPFLSASCARATFWSVLQSWHFGSKDPELGKKLFCCFVTLRPSLSPDPLQKHFGSPLSLQNASGIGNYVSLKCTRSCGPWSGSGCVTK